MAEQSAEGTPIIGPTPMNHKMRHDGYCTCGGIPLYVDDPQDMLVCSISREALQGERAQRSLRERDIKTFLTPEQRRPGSARGQGMSSPAPLQFVWRRTGRKYRNNGTVWREGVWRARLGPLALTARHTSGYRWAWDITRDGTNGNQPSPVLKGVAVGHLAARRAAETCCIRQIFGHQT